MSKISESDWMAQLHRASILYNEGRAHRDFQADEVYKFVECCIESTATPTPSQR